MFSQTNFVRSVFMQSVVIDRTYYYGFPLRQYRYGLLYELRGLWVECLTGRQTDRQVDRQMDKQADKLIDKQTERPTDISLKACFFCSRFLQNGEKKKYKSHSRRMVFINNWLYSLIFSFPVMVFKLRATSNCEFGAS